MGKSILFKLWVTIFCTLALALSAVLFVTHWSLQKGFIDYVNEKSVKQLGALEYILTRLHNEYGTWHILRYKRGLWREMRHRALLQQENDQHNSHYLKNFFEPLVLVDADRELVVGHPRRGAPYRWHPVVDGSTTLGYIGYIKPDSIIRTVDKLFLERQVRSIVAVGFLCLILSSLLAWLLSRHFVNPIKRLSAGAHTLASGDYSVRIPPNSHDELGYLCRSFNELACTLAANERSRRQWVADISHEMRTPLSVVKAQIEALQDGIRAPSPDNLNLVHNKVTALSRLIDDLYELSLSDLGALRYHKQPLSLLQVLWESIEGFEDTYAAAEMTLKTELELTEKDKVNADGPRLVQLFNNLLGNSLRYTNKPGTVLVKAKRRNEEVVITFEDTAPGVEPDQLERIFDRLYRGEQSRSRTTGGAGLGLSICRNIVAAHQGSMDAQLSRLGGLKITIALPLYSTQ